jgi:hypothetical protein
MLIFIISKKGNGSQPKKREIMKGTKNSGKFQQDAVIGQFSRDARRAREISPIVKAALAAGERNRIYRAEQEAKAKLNPRFVR